MGESVDPPCLHTAETVMGILLRGTHRTLVSYQAANANISSFAFTSICFLRLLLTCCPLRYSLPCRNLYTPIKSTLTIDVSNRYLTRGRIGANSPHICIKWQCAFGGGGRNRTAVQNTFLFASYSNKIRKYLFPEFPYFVLFLIAQWNIIKFSSIYIIIITPFNKFVNIFRSITIRINN